MLIEPSVVLAHLRVCLKKFRPGVFFLCNEYYPTWFEIDYAYLLIKMRLCINTQIFVIIVQGNIYAQTPQLIQGVHIIISSQFLHLPLTVVINARIFVIKVDLILVVFKCLISTILGGCGGV